MDILNLSCSIKKNVLRVNNLGVENIEYDIFVYDGISRN